MRRGPKRFAFFLLIAAGAAAAVFGSYRLADTLLNRMLVKPASSAPVSSAAASSAVSVQRSAPASQEAQSGASQDSAASSAVEGIFSDSVPSAREKLQTMSLKEKVGQVFVFRCPVSGAVKAVDDYQPGGYCLMADSFEGKTAAQVQKTLKSYQTSSKIKMILCCDEEGGTVVRVSKFPALASKPFQSPQTVYRLGGMDAVTADTVKKARLLKSLGLNMNLAPVADVSTDPSDFINARSFGKNAAETSKFITASVKAYESESFSCALKHFPGYGNNKDTHTAVVTDKRSYQSFVDSDFLPFEAGIKAGTPCILVSHNIVECIDPRNPASLSAKVHEVLRKSLGFTGVVMTDDLSMKGVTEAAGGKNPAVAAFLAGNDILLSSNMKTDFDALYAAVQSGTVSEERLDESVLRILAWKYSKGIVS